MYCACGAGQTPLEDRTYERDAVLPFPGGLRQKLVDVGRDRLVDGVLLGSEVEADRSDVTVGEQPAPVQVSQVLLQSAERPRTVFAEAKDIAADALGLLAGAMWFGKEIAVQQTDEVRETVVVPVVRCRGQQQQVVTMLGRPFRELVTLVRSTSSPRPADLFVYALHLWASSIMMRSQRCCQTRSRTSSCLA